MYLLDGSVSFVYPVKQDKSLFAETPLSSTHERGQLF